MSADVSDKAVQETMIQENVGLQWFAREISDYTSGTVAFKPLGPFQFGTAFDQIDYGFKGNLDLVIKPPFDIWIDIVTGKADGTEMIKKLFDCSICSRS
ncbi:MAG: hypothetical protein GY857_04075 [Desulfobacula sp.]|nr:hypothetical protein [Desulfobacula sp.]